MGSPRSNVPPRDINPILGTEGGRCKVQPKAGPACSPDERPLGFHDEYSPTHVYKIADAPEFAAAQDDGIYAGAPIDIEDGFIHLSTAIQVADTIRLYFKGRRNLVLVAVRVAGLGDGLRWEPSRGGALFPHLYGPLPMAAVDWVQGIDVDEDGNCQLPDRLG